MRRLGRILPSVLVLVSFMILWLPSPSLASVCSRTYTTDADFDEGILVNVNHDPPNNDQLQLNAFPEPFPFIWIANSARGTVCRVDTETGAILGEYRSAPEGRGLNPSRTTVDFFGNVWTGNRDESGGGQGSVVKIGLVIGGTRGIKNPDGTFTPDPNGEYLAPPFLYSTAVDRDSDGYIKTSRGLGHILSWPDITDGVGGPVGIVEDADDECILIFQRTTGPNVRHVSVDGNNDVWVGGYPFTPTFFDQLDGDTGAILSTFPSPDCGGYGGLIDGNNVLWSATISQNALLRRDLTTSVSTCIPVSQSYGLGIDTNGYIWNAMWSNNSIVKIAPDGTIQPGFPRPTGGSSSRGVAVTPVDNHVWVANSGSNTVTRLDNGGNLLNTINVGLQPTGVAVDADGKVWVTNLDSNNAMRIDPSGGGGLGAVDLTVDLGPGAGPYNYSDMTGGVLVGVVLSGLWDVVFDSGTPGEEWGIASWASLEPLGTGITVEVRAADTIAGLPSQPWVSVMNGVPFAGVMGRYIEIRTVLSHEPGIQDSPILYDLTIQCANRPPDCTTAMATPDELWPPRHKFVNVEIVGVTDPDGDPVTIVIDDVTQDEPLDGQGDGSFCPDARMMGDQLQIRAERMGPSYLMVPGGLGDDVAEQSVGGPGNGRVYVIHFTASDDRGGSCTGTATVCVPHDMRPGHVCIDDGQIVSSFGPCDPSILPPGEGVGKEITSVEMGRPEVTRELAVISYTLPSGGAVNLAVYDVAGRHVATLENAFRERGGHSVTWNMGAVARGVYYARIQANGVTLTRPIVVR